MYTREINYTYKYISSKISSLHVKIRVHANWPNMCRLLKKYGHKLRLSPVLSGLECCKVANVFKYEHVS